MSSQPSVPSPQYFYPTRGAHVQDPERQDQPLLPEKNEKAKYHPQTVVVYARNNRTCCIISCFLCGCCCALLLVLAILGGLIGAYVSQCEKLDATKTVTFTAPALSVSTLHFENTNGAISIGYANSTNVTITTTRKAISDKFFKDFEETWQWDADSIYYKEEYDGNRFWTSFGSCKKTIISITLPSSFSSIPSLRIITVNGDVTFNTMPLNETPSFKEIKASTSNGKVSLDHLISQGDVVAKTTNGDVKLGQIRATSVQASTTNGKVEGSKSVFVSIGLSAESTNGDISFSNISVTSSKVNLEFKTTNGDVQASLNNFFGYFDASTSNGKTQVSGNGIVFTKSSSTHKAGKVGDGQSNLEADTTNGDISLTFT